MQTFSQIKILFVRHKIIQVIQKFLMGTVFFDYGNAKLPGIFYFSKEEFTT
jgi:hypothetical protein